MDELNEMTEMTEVDENEVAMNGETDISEDTETMMVGARVLIGMGFACGVLALKTGQMIWNSKPATKMRNAAADKRKKIHDSMKSRSEERKRKKLAKLKKEVIDVEVTPAKEAVNE